ncbi:DUF3343 domain-containing protein [Anaerostipes sp.]|uniref:DUF3343 domain-containing protein n=1 Tax=Anaerostipes sp. TaxID=1872530 RepID=UPI0025BD9ED7|nr:DUF3343 domain-containing protein [Anaerostipes sp.]MBS7009736.1 DUF3343 domain-containing protein [Anaerostipes sp.]
MREKRLRLVVAFPNTTSAMAMEKSCRQNGTGGRLIAVPPEVKAGCGMAWCAELEEEASVKEILKHSHIETEGIYRMLL